jgi:Domain of unknown function (DUF4873)
VSVVLGRYTGPAVLSWGTGQTPVTADLVLRGVRLHGAGVVGDRAWSGDLQVSDGQAAREAFNAQPRTQLTLSIDGRSAEVVAVALDGAGLAVTGSGVPPFGDAS